MKDNNEEPVGYSNFSVRLRKNETSENLIKRFLKKTKKERIVEQVMENQHYKKPSVLKREDFARRQIVLEKLKQKERGDNLDE